MEKIFRHIGFVRLDSASVWEVFYWLTPEFIVLPAVIAMYLICNALMARQDSDDIVSPRQESYSEQKKTEDKTTMVITFLYERFSHLENSITIP